VLGPAGLRAVAAAVAIPVVAIGGIHAGNVGELRGIGLAGVSVVSAICAAPDPTAAAAGLTQLFKSN